MRGFSLMEIVVVVALLGILGVAALPLVYSPDPVRLDAASKQVLSDIEYARQLAMATNVTHGVSFVANGAYTVYRTVVGSPVSSPLTHQSMVITLSSRYPGVTIRNNYTVEFDSLGSPTVGGGGSVVIINASGSRTVSVTAATGKVLLQ